MAFTEDLKSALSTARSEAARLRHQSIHPVHFALGLLHEPRHEVTAVLAGASAPDLTDVLVERAGLAAGPEQWAFDIPYSDGAREVIAHALREARELGHADVGCGHLVLGLLQMQGTLPHEVLASAGLTLERTRESLR